ncbi:MAG TPA: hypothetical protein VNQ76_20035 [Planctomicrobium sp.]|nr:hypothetical protein [Planctomicrobium sp.]
MFRQVSKADCLAVALILSASFSSSWAVAQDVRQTAGARPIPMESAAPLSPALESILLEWEKESASVTRMNGQFNRVVYDSVFNVAKCSTGSYAYESPDKGMMNFLPDNAAASRHPGKVQRGDIEFTLQVDEAQRWVCDGEQILSIDPTNKEYNRVVIPPRFRGANISEGPLPFLFGMKAEKMKQRYVLELGRLHDPANIIHIVAYPKMPEEQREYRVAEVLLYPDTFFPRAIQLATSENRQTVYIFTTHEKMPSFTLFKTNPFKPSLLGYKILHDAEAPAPLDRESRKQDGIILR